MLKRIELAIALLALLMALASASTSAFTITELLPFLPVNGDCPLSGGSGDMDCAQRYGGIVLEKSGSFVLYACVPLSSDDRDEVCLRDLGVSCKSGGHDPDCARAPEPISTETCVADGNCVAVCPSDPDCKAGLGQPCTSPAGCASGYCSFHSYGLQSDTRSSNKYCVEKATIAGIDSPKCALVDASGAVHSVQSFGVEALGTNAEKAPYGYLCSKDDAYYGCILVGSDALYVEQPGMPGGDYCNYCTSDSSCAANEFCDKDHACKSASGRAELCNDGKDNNANGLIDAADDGCTASPEGNLESLSFACAGPSPGLSIAAWSADPDDLNSGAADIHFYHKNPADTTSASLGSYLGRTSAMPGVSRPDVRTYLRGRYYVPESSSLLAADRFGVSGTMVFASTVPAELKRAGTTLSVSAYALDKSGGNHFKKLTLSGGRDVVGVVVGQCSGALKSVGEVCTSTPECDSDMYCSYGENDLQDNGEAGHCCAVGVRWVQRGRVGVCEEPLINLKCASCQLNINDVTTSISQRQSYEQNRRSGNFPVQLSVFDRIRLFFYRPEATTVIKNTQCIRELNGVHQACLYGTLYGEENVRFWQEYTIYENTR